MLPPGVPFDGVKALIDGAISAPASAGPESSVHTAQPASLKLGNPKGTEICQKNIIIWVFFF